MKIISINMSDLSVSEELVLMDKLKEFYPLSAFDDETITVTESDTTSTLVSLQYQEIDVISRALLALQTMHYTEEDKDDDLTSTERNLLDRSVMPVEMNIIRSLYNTNFDWDEAMIASDEPAYFKKYK